MENVPEAVGPFTKGEVKRMAIMADVSVDTFMKIVRATLDAQVEKESNVIDRAANKWIDEQGFDKFGVADWLRGRHHARDI